MRFPPRVHVRRPTRTPLPPRAASGLGRHTSTWYVPERRLAASAFCPRGACVASTRGRHHPEMTRSVGMVSSDIARRHRTIMAELATRWRRRADQVTQEPPVPYDDDDELPDDRERVVVEVLGRLIGKLGAVDVASCATPADVDRVFAERVRAEIGIDMRPGALEAARIVFSLLQVPVSLPEPDSPALGDTAG